MPKKRLTPRQKAFRDNYVVNPNATKAALAAGYSPSSAGNIGSELMGKPEIREAIAAKQQSVAEKLGITAEYVLGGIQKVIKGCEQDVYQAKDGRPTAILKGKELLGKHLRLFIDRVEVSGQLDLAERISKAREVKE